jgi:hypothetical protein
VRIFGKILSAFGSLASKNLIPSKRNELLKVPVGLFGFFKAFLSKRKSMEIQGFLHEYTVNLGLLATQDGHDLVSEPSQSPTICIVIEDSPTPMPALFSMHLQSRSQQPDDKHQQ